MGWSKQQNPTGISNPAVRPIPIDPNDKTTTAQEARAILRAQSGHKVASNANELPIAANARKADGFTPNATSAGQ